MALLLAELARRGHRQPEMRPKPSTNQGNSTALRATQSPTTARKGAPKGRKYGGPVKCLNRPQEGPANRPYFAYKIYGLGSHRPGGGFFCRDPPGDHKRYTSEKWDEVRTAHIDQGGGRSPSLRVSPWGREEGDVVPWMPAAR
ncbi:MAG: hypothetical protein A2Y80_04880 [Deltaproteobacteria bacterium RBG_13_58_19]|nr:MAG: hypothetical protein A2Y80_04880 [Deltaproteobacteria bacterium RBG_13_58_19]